MRGNVAEHEDAVHERIIEAFLAEGRDPSVLEIGFGWGRVLIELARHKIRVNALCPGYFVSEMTEAFLAGPDGMAMLGRIPQRRIGGADELDGALLLLASDAGAYMTGSIITVDGGHSLVGA